MVRPPPPAADPPPDAPETNPDRAPADLQLRPVRRERRASARVMRECATAGEPLVVEGALDGWPALGRWTPELLRERAGSLRVKTYVLPRGHVRLDARTGFVFEEMTMADYVAHVLSGDPPRYYLRTPLDALPRHLASEVGVPEYCRGAVRLRSNVWFSAPGTVSRLHFDLPHNLIAQLHGRKRYLLFPWSERRNLYPFSPLSSVPHLSRVDLEAPDLARFPRLARARGWQCDLGEGDLLFLPQRTWHHARSLGSSVMVNFWWPSWPTLPFVLASDLYKHLRGLNI